jgi:hypothetical protein
MGDRKKSTMRKPRFHLINPPGVIMIGFVMIGVLVLIAFATIGFGLHYKHYFLPVMRIAAICFAGILSAMALFLFYYNTMSNQFENKFFAQVQMHRDNVNSIDKSLISDSKGAYTPHYFFKQILSEYRELDKVINELLKDKPIDEVILKNKIAEENRVANRLNIHTKELTRFNITYLVVFFGIKEDKRTVENILKSIYSASFVESVFKAIDSKLSKDKLLSKMPLSGYQGVLGHYYRHLYQTVRFVHTRNTLFKDAKLEYVKTLRAQLSTFEQALLLINSISTIGRDWELNETEKENGLITQYEMVKNLPAEFVDDVEAQKLYPNIKYEGLN